MHWFQYPPFFPNYCLYQRSVHSSVCSAPQRVISPLLALFPWQTNASLLRVCCCYCCCCCCSLLSASSTYRSQLSASSPYSTPLKGNNFVFLTVILNVKRTSLLPVFATIREIPKPCCSGFLLFCTTLTATAAAPLFPSSVKMRRKIGNGNGHRAG